MASLFNAMVCAGLAVALWTCIGLPLSLQLMPRSMAWPVAPTLGWAVHSALVLPVFCVLGMTKTTVNMVTALILVSAIVALSKRSCPLKNDADNGGVSLWTVGGAAVLATAIMALILPQITAGGVTFADAIFDHSKVAMIDEMARSGVPSANPFFGESDGLTRLSYYYLWHFSAAELVVLTGLSGWEADAGMTWFTAFSSITLMMGFASFLSARSAAAAWVLILATTFSIRPILSMLFGREITYAVTGWPSGFGAWLFQMTWAPQHIASAGCVLIAVFLLIDLSRNQRLLTGIVFSLVVAAAFESSTWVGGVTFTIGAAAIGSLLLLRIVPGARVCFVLTAIGAAALAMAISSPFIYDQIRASAIRTDVSPISILPYQILGDETPAGLRDILDVPAYWSVFLFTEFAAFHPAGIVMLVLLTKDRWIPQARKMYLAPFGVLAFVSLAVASMLFSQLGANNDLAWRGVLPAIFVLISFSAAGLSRYLRSMRWLYVLPVLALIGMTSFVGIWNLFQNLNVRSRQPSIVFVESAGMWAAVRQHSKNDERVANNPMFLSEVTAWPINLSWALLSNRRSCYAGVGFAPFAPRTKLPLNSVDRQFEHVFSGDAEAGDLAQLAHRYDCAVVVITSQDGAWTRDPFLSSPLYDLVESKAESWRIYKRRASYEK